MTISVVDTETTGVDPKTCHVVEVAIVDLTKDGIDQPFTSFIKPPEGVKIPPEVSAVTHIIDADVSYAPALAQVLPRFQGRKALVAHNAAFDMGFLPGICDTWVCTMKVAMRAWPEAPAFSNQALRYWLGEISPFGIDRHEIAAHRGGSDVIVTAAIFHRLIKAGVTWAQMVQWSKEPCLYPRMLIGKERGKKMADVDAGFLEWMLGKSDFADWHHTCRTELERRRANAKAGG